MKNSKIYKLCIIILLLYSVAGNAQQKDSLKIVPGIDIGYGVEQNINKATASFSMVSGEELRRSSAINLKDALYGKLLGLTALKSGGFEGDSGFGAWFNIRGNQTTSKDENKVLILIDGFERPIDRISLEEVESVTVLKDAAAVAIYGYKGVNGVINVITKRGVEGVTRVNVNYMHKLTFLPEIPDFVNGYTYAKALNEARANDLLTPMYNNFELLAFRNNSFPLVYPNVNWKDEVLRDMGSERQANLSITGGDSKVKYYTLLNYEDNKGLLEGTEMNNGYSTQLKSSKANIRLNMDYELTKTTKVNLNVLGTFIETNRPHGVAANDVFNLIYTIPSSAFPIRTEDGTWGGNSTYKAKNPVAQIQNTGYRKSHARSLFADIKILQDLGMLFEGLSASVRAGYDNYAEIVEDRSRGFQYGNDRFIFDYNTGDILETLRYRAGDKTNNLSFNKWLNSQWRRFNFVASIDYSTTLAEKHNFNFSGIYNSEAGSTDGRYNTIMRTNWIGYLHYDFNDRYVADVVLTATGSNRAYPEKWDVSPTASLGWVLSNESFLKDNNFITFLKLRGSAGILHTDFVPRNGLTFEDYSASGGNYFFGQGYNENWGFYMGYLPTKSFKHETANKFNLGLDVKLLDALGLTAEVYKQHRTNILQSANGLNSTIQGLPSPYINKGIVDSKGLELGLNFSKTIRDFTLSFGTLFTYATNEIVDMVETPQAYSYLSRIGSSVNQTFGLESTGLFMDQKEINSSPIQEFDVVHPGDIKYKDQNSDGTINLNDQVALKYSDGLPQINYAFNVAMEYKGLGVNAYFQGVSNYNIYLKTSGIYLPITSENLNLSQHYLENAWRPGADNSNAKYPRLTSQSGLNNGVTNSSWLKDASFLKLRHFEVYYRLSSSLVNKLNLRSAKVFVKGENLLSFHSSDIVVDPEVYWTAYPTLKSVALGISLTF